MEEVSSISAMKVDIPRSWLSPAPTRTRMASTMEIVAELAGTKQPICAINTIMATCRMYLQNGTRKKSNIVSEQL